MLDYFWIGVGLAAAGYFFGRGIERAGAVSIELGQEEGLLVDRLIGEFRAWRRAESAYLKERVALERERRALDRDQASTPAIAASDHDS